MLINSKKEAIINADSFIDSHGRGRVIHCSLVVLVSCSFVYYNYSSSTLSEKIHVKLFLHPAKRHSSKWNPSFSHFIPHQPTTPHPSIYLTISVSMHVFHQPKRNRIFHESLSKRFVVGSSDHRTFRVPCHNS